MTIEFAAASSVNAATPMTVLETMRNMTIRVPEQLLQRLRRTSRRTGLSIAAIVRSRLEAAKAAANDPHIRP